MAKYPKVLHPGMCDVTLGVNGFNDVVVDSVQQNFELSPDYNEVYIIHDSSKEQDFLHDANIKNDYGLKKYKTWIFDGTEREQIVGHKYIQMYPYDMPVLEIGDYVSYDYYRNGTKSTFLCVAIDPTTVYEQIGKIRQCTNEVRFMNEDGVVIRVPCVFDDKINSEKNTSLYNLKYINGITTIYMQMNSDSQQLKPNQRLLFGRPGGWTAFRVVAVGVNNFMNKVFWDNETSKILEITMEASYVNEDYDDVVNGIADVIKYFIELHIDNPEMKIDDSVQLQYSIMRNDDKPAYNGVVWSSSNPYVATVDEKGVVTAHNIGECYIKVAMASNESVYAETSINVVEEESPNYEIVVSPYDSDSYGILQGSTQKFDCYLYNNGIKLDDEFEFSVETEANDLCYEFESDINSFTVKNVRMSAYPIIVKCVSGEHIFNANIILKGAW